MPANWRTESKLVRPLVTDDSSWDSSRSFRMKETCSGVLGGVLPNADAPGSAEARVPVGTFSGVLGPGVVEACAVPAVAATGAATASTPAASPAQRRERTEKAMLGHTPHV
jgi:hypothetical protein